MKNLRGYYNLVKIFFQLGQKRECNLIYNMDRNFFMTQRFDVADMISNEENAVADEKRKEIKLIC